MIAKSIFSASAQLTTDSESVATTSGFISTSRPMYSLPGAQITLSGEVPVLISAFTIACSLAPEPTTRILILVSLLRELLGQTARSKGLG